VLSLRRKALFRSLIRGLVLHGRIKTTEAKAKAIKGEVEKFVTKAKKRGEEAEYHLLKNLSHDLVIKIISEIAPRFKERQGGYTRIIRLGRRLKDNAEMVLLEWVEGEEVKDQGSNIKDTEESLVKKVKKEVKKTEKKSKVKKEEKK